MAAAALFSLLLCHRRLLFLATLLVWFLPDAAETVTDPGDVASMHALATGLGADRALGWSPLTDPCAASLAGPWTGVSCSPDGRVTAIQVGNRSLSGILPAAIQNLTALVRLELHLNRLSGSLPSLSGLTSLQALLLHGNRFSSVPPDFFTGLSSLQSAYLDNNPSLAPWPLPYSLRDCAALVNFSAISANISGSLPAFLATAFPGLDHLALSFNLLSGPVPPAFAASPLRSLWLNNQLGEARLSGGLDFVANMSSLQQLWLHSNDFSGPLPDFSGLTELQDLQLRDNRLTGPVPKSLVELPSLAKVTLANNLLQGPVPEFPSSVKDLDLDLKTESFCLASPGPCDPRVDQLLAVARGFGYPARFAESWKGNNPCDGWLGISCDANGNITAINFQKMDLNGTISPDFGAITSLQRLILANNKLTGTIPPVLANLPSLKELDVSNNLLWGKVPTFSQRVSVETSGNQNIGKDGGPPNPNSGLVSNDGGSSSNISSNGSSTGSSSGKDSSARIGVILGSLAAVVAVIGLIALAVIMYLKRKQQRFARVQSPNTTVIHPQHSGSDPDVVKVTIAGSNANGTTAVTETFSGPSEVHMVEAGNMVISIQVLRNVTNNFSEESVLGRGGFGTVYKGELHDGTKIAVKRMEAGIIGTKGLNEFKSEIAVLTKVRHRNLVSLLGYCLDGNERLLVYEYMSQGALSRHLYGWKDEGLKPLEWKKRLSIALDVARGVEYLHNLAQQSFIHRDLKPANILLGDDMKAKVADFGLVRLAPADDKGFSVETRLAGTFGYLAPEYAVTGRVTTKADVFSFGVILMELITGRKALDESHPEESVHLVTWFRRMLLNKDTFRKAIDPTIDLDEETIPTINTIAELAGHCCAREPYQRPDMGHAVNVLSTLAEFWKPSDPDSEDSYGIDLDMTLPQALKKWQAFDDSSHMDGATSSFLANLDNTHTSIPTMPPGFADSFTSADGR